MSEEANTAVYLYAYLQLTLEADLATGLLHWERAFDKARQQWQLGQAATLIALLKRYELSLPQRAALTALHGHLLAQQTAWAQAIATYQKSLHLLPNHPDALLGLGNVLRRMEGRAAEAVACYQQALATADPSARPALLNSLALAHYEAGQLAKAEEVWQTAVHATQQTPTASQSQLPHIQHNLGSLYWTRGQLPQAEANFQAALASYEQQQDPHAQAETLNSLGLIHEARGDWALAAHTYRQALLILQQHGDEYGQIQILLNLGNALTLLRQLDEADVCFQSGLNLARDMQDARLEGQLLTGLAELRHAQGQNDSALAFFEQAIARKQAAGDQRSLKHSWLSLAGFYQTQRQPKQAEQAYHTAVALAQAQQDQRVEAHGWLGLAQLAHAQEHLTLVPNYLHKAKALALPNEYDQLLAEIYRLEGDLELNQPEPNYHHLLVCYVSALGHAYNFNEQTLEEIVAYLLDLLQAMAEDGDPSVAHRMAADLAELAQTAGLPPQTTKVFKTFPQVRCTSKVRRT